MFLSSFQVRAETVPSFYAEKLKKFSLIKNDQAFCLGDENEITFDHNLTKTMKPASVSKLYVTDWALKTVGKDYRYETKFALQNKTLYIKGGDDPFFVTESVMAVIEYLNKMGINDLDLIVFDSHFNLNWFDDKTTIATQLKEYFNKANPTVSQEMNDIRIRTQSLGLDFFETREISKVKEVKYSATIDETVFQNGKNFSLKSSPLYKHLKQMNIYSTNFYAQKLFDHLGGIEAFHEYMKNEFEADQTQIKFYTGSGLGENYTTCGLTLKLLTHLNKTVEDEQLDLKEVVSVAGSDLGTLRNRFTTAPINKSVIAKTGTLNSITTLAGFLYTQTGLKYFTIFNRTADLTKGRSFENEMIEALFKNVLIPEPIEYTRIDYSPLDDVILE
jgi:D-alanyl-D-alanine carboxypeptidase/D-alanyl-D-alanine-endopeptidase (penicillin-binding protein 4)